MSNYEEKELYISDVIYSYYKVEHVIVYATYKVKHYFPLNAYCDTIYSHKIIYIVFNYFFNRFVWYR